MALIARPLLFMVLTLILSVAYIYCDALMQEKGVKLTELKSDTAVVQKENAALTAEIAKLSSSDRIEEIASNELGMVRAGEENIVYYTVAETVTEKKEETVEAGTESAGSYGIFSVFRRIFPDS